MLSKYQEKQTRKYEQTESGKIAYAIWEHRREIEALGPNDNEIPGNPYSTRLPGIHHFNFCKSPDYITSVPSIKDFGPIFGEPAATPEEADPRTYDQK